MVRIGKWTLCGLFLAFASFNVIYAASTPVVITNALVPGSNTVSGTGKSANSATDLSIQIFICAVKAKPATTSDCSSGGSAPLTFNPKAPGTQYVSTDVAGKFSATLANALDPGDYVYVSQVARGESTVMSPVVAVSVPPLIASSVSATVTVVSGHGQVVNTDFPSGSAQIYVCVQNTKPLGEPDCSNSTPATITNASVPGKQAVTVDTNGAFSATLATPLPAGTYVWVTQLATPSGGPVQTTSTAPALVSSKPAAAVTASPGEQNCGNAYSDCDEQSGLGFSLVGGLEQSYLSSEANETDGFLRAFTKVNIPVSDTWTVAPWAVIRDLGAPSANSTQNLVSAISNPDGSITSSSLSTIGYAVDFLVGVGLDHPIGKTTGQYSMGPIVAFGATTPLSSASATSGFKVALLGTEECSELQARFASAAAYQQGYSSNLVAGTPGTSTPPNTNCLLNTAGGGSTGVTTLAFSGVNRSSFLEKWEVGARTIYRTYTKSGQKTCDSSNACLRGVVDFTVGQDAAITGGMLRHFVFKIDAIQPLPYSGGYLYIFGTAALRFERNTSLPPLILMPAASSDLQNIPSPSVFVEPFRQPNKDFYRIGVGLSVDKIFSSLKKPAS